MKSLLVILLVCVASTFALEAGPYYGLVQQIQETLHQAIQQLIQTVIALIPNKPKFLDLNSILSLLNIDLTQITSQLEGGLQQILGQLVNNLLGGIKPRHIAQVEAQVRIIELLNNLGGQLQTLINQLISNLLGGALNTQQRLDLAPILSSLIQTVIDKLKPQLLNIVSQLVSSLANGKRGILDTIVSAFNLSDVWSTIQGLGSNLVGQFQAILTQLLFAGTQAWNNAKPIFAQLVSDLTNHIGDASSILANAIAQLSTVVSGSGKRDVLDFIANQLGLGAVWDQIVQAGSGVVAQIVAIGTQLLFAGQQIINNAKPILQQLVSDLTNHIGDAVPLIQQAIAQLTQVVGKRDLVDFLLNNLGLGAVWDQIQQAGTSIVNQFLSVVSQVVFAGTQAWNNAKPILQQLIQDLKDHVGNAVPLITQAIAQLSQIAGKRDITDFLANTLGLSAVWSQIQQIGAGVVAQFVNIGTQLLFAGQQIWDNAKPIFSQLVSDLTNHVGDASTIITNALNSLNQVVGK